MIFRQLFDNKSSTFTYLLADEVSKSAVIIDPVFEQTNRDLALIHELGLNLAYTIDTHCHADHVTASWLLKHQVNSDILCAEVIKAENVDRGLKHGDVIRFGQYELEVRATPGHTDGCLTFVCHQEKMAFTGDALLIRGCGRCDFQQGDAGILFDSITQQILSLPDDYRLFPGHDYSGRCETSVIEEKLHNVRLGGEANKQDFVGYMDNMILPHPKFIDIALPANLKAGKPESIPETPDWAPLEYTYGGFYEVEAEWVAANLSNVVVLDVREQEEVANCKIANSLCIPLGQLNEKLHQLPIDKPILAFCRSGRRSALAVNMLKAAGYKQIANIKGGILHWQDIGLPTVST